MKRLLLVVIIGILLFFTSMLVGIPANAQESTPENEINQATIVAQQWLGKLSSTQLEQWEDAKLSEPQIYYDLDGRLICFKFAVMIIDKTIGTITIGSSLYQNTLFEANTGQMPNIPSSVDVRDIAIKDLGIDSTSSISEKPERLLHLGINNNYAVYQTIGHW